MLSAGEIFTGRLGCLFVPNPLKSMCMDVERILRVCVLRTRYTDNIHYIMSFHHKNIEIKKICIKKV